MSNGKYNKIYIMYFIIWTDGAVSDNLTRKHGIPSHQLISFMQHKCTGGCGTVIAKFNTRGGKSYQKLRTSHDMSEQYGMLGVLKMHYLSGATEIISITISSYSDEIMAKKSQ